MKHTNGKWAISSSILVVSEDARIIADTMSMMGVPDLCVDMPEAVANAHLIAAAPDLLAALKSFPVKLESQTYQQFYNCCMSWIRTDREIAIAKAEKTE